MSFGVTTTCVRSMVSGKHYRILVLLIGTFVQGCRPDHTAVDIERKADEGKPVLQTTPTGEEPETKVSPRSQIRETTLSVKEEWRIEGLGAPAGMIYDPETQDLRLAQIGGEGDARDGDGALSRVSTNGQMLEFSWARGMNAPKDLVVDHDSVWVTDIDTVHELDRKSGEIRRSIKVPDAKFLVGIAVDDERRLLLADLLASRLYRLRNGECEVLHEGRDLQSPSRVSFESNRLIVTTWGFTADFSGDALGNVFAWDATNKRITALAVPMSGHWMGLCRNGEDGLFLGDFQTGTILRVLKNHQCEKIVTLGRGLGAILYLPDDRLLLATHITENRLIAFRLSEIVVRR